LVHLVKWVGLVLVERMVPLAHRDWKDLVARMESLAPLEMMAQQVPQDRRETKVSLDPLAPLVHLEIRE